MSIGGKVNAVIGDINFYSAVAPLAVYANKQIAQNHAVGDLYQLVRDGKWTWDAMHSIARDVTRDLDGDGVITQNDQIGLFIEYLHLQAAVSSAGEFFTPKNDDDIPAFAPNIERIADITEKVSAFFHDQNAAIFAESITGYSNQFYEFILPKFRDNQMMFLINQLLFSFDLRGMDADFAILPFPKYDENQENYNSVVASWWGTYTVIPITNVDVDMTANILDAMGYFSQKHVMPAYYDRTVTSKLIRDDESAEMLDIILNNRIFDLAELYNWGDINGMLINIARSGDAGGIVSQIERIEGRVNTAIQRTLAGLEID
jgi:hypothetical protein